MKWLFLFLSSGIAFAELPRLTVEHDGRRQDLRVDEIEVSVQVEGDFVQTRMDLVFFNETNLNQEGEFRLPLPEGASVNHYALEVEGRMRAATVVEKEQARHAYETIKAENIDPGLVEKIEGNVYRTRIFPVLPKQTKRVSIGYVQPLVKVGQDLLYRLPFGVEEEIGYFEIIVEGDLEGLTATMVAGSDLRNDGERFLFSSKSAPVKGELVVRKSVESGHTRGEIRNVGNENFVYVTGSFPASIDEMESEKPESLTILWDASAGGYDRDLVLEREMLGDLLKKWGDISVRLLAVHSQVEDLGEFQIRGGNWEKLRLKIDGIFHDGVADWRKVDFQELSRSRLMIFGGEESALPFNQSKISGVLQIVRSGGVRSDKILTEMAERSGGGIIELGKDRIDEAVGKILKPAPRVVNLGGAEEMFTSYGKDGSFRIFARLKEIHQDVFPISIGRGRQVFKTVHVDLNRKKSGEALRYLWAQRKLSSLVSESSFLNGRQKAGVIEHCQRYGLISDYTSLIVLERMEDHIRFRIPPPEPELMASYEEGIRNRDTKASKIFKRDYLKWAWDRRVAWYQKKFPWIDGVLLPRYMRVNKWIQAQTSVFEKEQLEQTNLPEFISWRDKAAKVIRSPEAVQSRAELLARVEQIKGLLVSSEKLGGTDAKLPANGNFGVSVRGLVQQPKTLSLKTGATLRDAVEQAGGIHPYGSATRVALYRSGKRKVFNLLSKAYADIELLPGDMIVAMAEEYEFSDDPFWSGQTPEQKTGGPAVVDGDVPLSSSYPELRDAFAGSNNSPFGTLGGSSHDGREPRLQFRGEIRKIETQESKQTQIKEILEAEDFWSAYRTARPEIKLKVGDLAKVAEALYKRNEPEKARRALTNAYFGRGIHVPSLRAAAYWMLQLGDVRGAEEIFKLIATNFPDDALVILDLMRVDRMKEEDEAGEIAFDLPVANIKRLIRKSQNLKIAEMVLMEQNRFEKKSLDFIRDHRPGSRETFPCDIRVFVSSSQPQGRAFLKVTEPSGETVPFFQTSQTGGRITSGAGVAEFMVKRALPGKYELDILQDEGEGTYQMEVFLNWGRPNESQRLFTFSGEGGKEPIDGGEVSADFYAP